MKSGKRVAAVAALAVCAAVAGLAQLENWVQHAPSGPLIGIFFRSVPMPGGSVPIRRPPGEARPALSKALLAAPQDAALHLLRAREAELALDMAAAEADWRTYALRSPDSYRGNLELADFYHRRARPQDEVAALLAASQSKDDPLQQPQDQRAWKAFERIAALIETERLPDSIAGPAFRAWVARYPHAPEARRKLIEHLIARKQYAAAQQEIAAYRKTVGDRLYPVQARADLALLRGSAGAAVRVYDEAFQPLWPDEMMQAYLRLLEKEGRLREFSGRARTALQANPTDLNATSRLFHYFHRPEGNPAAARRVLLEHRLAKESRRETWTAEELQTLAQLFERLSEVNEVARLYYALYSLPPVNGRHVDSALYGLANLLLTAPEQPIRFGSGDLSFYQDVATVDPSPGFLNGILSLLLNSASPRWEYREQNQKSHAYFHRAAAAQLVTLFERRFPKSPQRAPLRAGLVTAYAAYSDDESVIRAGRAYLSDFPAGGARASVALQVANALARQEKLTEEFALYDQMLREFAAKASGVPVGAKAEMPDLSPPARNWPPPAAGVVLPVQRLMFGGQEAKTPSTGRSAEYVQVLDRYLARLVTMDKRLDALRVYRTEIDRNPADPGLYERMAVFLEQNSLTQQIEEVYTRAIAKFNEPSWYHKLARWYLRQNRAAALDKITRDAVAVFSGSEVEEYFRDIVAQTYPDAALYRQLNLYAHQRFPEDLAFVRNLMGAYTRKETYDAAAAERLLRQYWFYDPELRARFFGNLSRTGRLYSELAEARKLGVNAAANPAAVQFVAEGELWLSHFEAAAPFTRTLAGAFPGRRGFTGRAADLHRSLAAYFPDHTEMAVKLAEAEFRSEPRDQSTLAKIGDILADREMFTRAAAYWNRMPEARPENTEAWLDAATVFWDYYRYDDALRILAAARKKFADPSLFAYEAGAIYEGKRDYGRAIAEYRRGAMAGGEESWGRLVRLATRASTRGLVDRATAGASDGLRIAILEAQQRRADLEALLQARVATEKSQAGLEEIAEAARRHGFPDVEVRAAEQQRAIAADPVDRMRLTLALVRLYEAKNDAAAAARTMQALYRDRPEILGVVRGTVDFQVRNGQQTEAVSTLLDAAKRARPDLSARFTLEAARVATGAGRFEQARGILGGLLAAEPERIEYLSAMGDTYLQAKDDAGFRDYQVAVLEKLKPRSDAAAALRRSLIPALSRLGDHAAAVDQYIELINRYPEDEGLTREAAGYAVAHKEAARVVAFYRKTIADAPRDYRWPVVLGRVETITEDYPAAIAAYERALEARPDRSDVLEAKARLEERLMRFADALKSYRRLYELAYHDPQWLIKAAELHARLGQSAECVDALRTAIIGARTETAEADFAIAQRLEEWHIFPQALEFAERGAACASPDLMTKSEGHTYVRILARARRMETLLDRLPREDGQYSAPARAAGNVIAEIYSPEEKFRLEQLLRKSGPRIALAAAAAMPALEAQWRLDAMAAWQTPIDQSFATLQWQRGLFGESGRQLEQLALKASGTPGEGLALSQAARAFIAEGDLPSQMRVMRTMLARNSLSGELLDRYLALLSRHQAAELLVIARAGASPEICNRAVQFAIASDNSKLAYDAVRARGSSLTPTWANAYTGLTGVYLEDRSPQVASAFRNALDARTIGERVAASASRDGTVAGTLWFYFASRFGEHLSRGGDREADVWLPAMLEEDPASPTAYLEAGDFLAAQRRPQEAIRRYESALELDPNRAVAHARIARVAWSQDRRAEAMARWRSALATLLRVQGRGVRVPESFWSQAAETFTDLGERHALAELRTEITHLLRDYVNRNDSYRLDELLEPLARASLASGESTAWVVELGRSLDYSGRVLDILTNLRGLTTEQRIALQREKVAEAERNVASTHGYEREYQEGRLRSIRLDLISRLLDAGDARGAAAEWGRIPEQQQTTTSWRRDPLVEIGLRVASRSGSLDARLAKFMEAGENAPSAETLREAAVAMREHEDEEGARTVLAFLYDRELRAGRLEAANFLGLAEVHLLRNQPASALTLLRRMSLVTENPFDTLLGAADLLARHGRNSESAEFVRKRVQAVPWDAQAKLRLARVVSGPEREQLLVSVLHDAQASYRHRADAARMGARAATGTELEVLSSGSVTPTVANRPYFVEARLTAAESAKDQAVQARLYHEALALAPSDQRARLGALQSALRLRRDSTALALAQAGLPETDPQRTASLSEALAGSAERLEDFETAQKYLKSAIPARPSAERPALERKLQALAAEQQRRASNAARQPVVKDVIEQDQVVRPRIQRSAR